MTKGVGSMCSALRRGALASLTDGCCRAGLRVERGAQGPRITVTGATIPD